MMEALGSYETLVRTRATRRNITEDDIFHGCCLFGDSLCGLVEFLAAIPEDPGSIPGATRCF
jgi:hypothetical protein